MIPEKCRVLGSLVLFAACVHPGTLHVPEYTEQKQNLPKAIYFVLVDRFSSLTGAVSGAPHDFHGGDLWGVLKNLDWIQGMGFDAIWLSPVWETRKEPFGGYGAFHGYWVTNPTRVDPGFGGEAALAALSEEMERRNMRLVLDMVYNHTAWDSPLRTQHPDWFHPAASITDWSDATQVQTHEVHGLPDLAQENPDVYQYLRQVSLDRIQTTHPAGFRIDAVKHLDPGFLPKLARDILFVAPDFFLLGEIFDGNPKSLSEAWKYSDLTSVFDFPLYYALIDFFCHDAAPGRLATMLAQDFRYAHPERLVTFLDNHDLPRIASACNQDVARIESAWKLLFSLRGVPSMTYGTEVGLLGASEPENRGDMLFLEADPADRYEKIRDALTARSPLMAYGQSWIAALGEDSVDIGQRYQGETQVVRVTRKSVQVVPATLALPSVRSVTVTGEPGWALVGSHPSLGDWSPENARALDGNQLTVDLPAGAVYAVKWVRREGAGWGWEAGDNRYIFVPPGTGELSVALPGAHLE